MISRRMILAAALVILASAPIATSGATTGTCEDKRAWQRRIVERAVARWFEHDARPMDLLELIQAEQGIAACSNGSHRPLRLHTSTLPADLEMEQFAAYVLANELEWSGLVPEPERGLAGEWFEVKPRPGLVVE